MQHLQLGARDLWVSRLLFGTLTMGPLQRNLPIEQGAALIAYAYARGVTAVDTAEYYQNYAYIKAALPACPGLTVITKSYAYTRDGAKRSVELAQEGMGIERIGAFLMHEQESEHTLRGHAEAFDYYQELRDAGVIGAVGISTHHVAAVRAAARWPGMDIVFPMINVTGLGIADGTRADMEAAILEAHAAGRGILGMKALGGGHLIGDREAALDYALALPGIDAIALGMQSEAEIDYNIARFEGRKPDPDIVAKLDQTPRRLIVQDWCIGCGRCAGRCGQGALVISDGKAVLDAEHCITCGYCAAVCPEFCLKVI
ncbi:MAG: aldo/keto reductase [Oscillospiraceae bacterium]|jgi:aryl-alcohol dehydrogenase-like predicted oxidoreductase/ferredoxin|nr:aldo/keto reductase [Oscillospiraceae bacterium]